MDQIKSVMIMGTESVGGAKKTRKTAKKQRGGEEPVVPAAPAAPAASITVTRVEQQPPQQPPQQPQQPQQAQVIQAPQQQPQQQAQPQQGGDTKRIRVELKKKPQTKRVQLHPKKIEPKLATKKTKKNRKVLLGVSSLHKRMTRAKKVQTKVKEMPLDKLKALLITKKLMKPTSKAPESVLRQIAVDAQIMEGKAL